MFKPLLASPADDNLDFSRAWLASPKLDGVRAIVRGGVVLSRSLKPIPNPHVQKLFGHLEHFDGELIVGEPNAHDVLRKTTSGVMSKDGEPDVRFCVFDHIAQPAATYRDRLSNLEADMFALTGLQCRNVFKLEQTTVENHDELRMFETEALGYGYEGVMLRDPNGHYKFGRSTAREGLLLKVKRFTDGEFEIVGFDEEMFNGNAATTNELGRTKRSSHKAGKVAKGRLGALVLKYGDTTFNCGTGFDDDLRAEIWANRDKYLGQMAKIKYFAYGIKDVPKPVSFLAIRDPRDM